MNDKILSVSIAAYNVSSTLEEALIPFTAENIKGRVDVMIVDDGSKDATPQIAHSYELKYPGTFRLISKENGGWGSTLNVGISMAQGKYFKQLDGDDSFSIENLSAFLDFLQKTDADMVYSPFITYDDATHGIFKMVGGYAGTYAMLPLNLTIPLNECNEFMPAMHCLTVKTEVLRRNKITITEKCFYTDVEYVLKSYNSCDTVTFFERPIYYYRLARAGQSMSIQGVQKHYRDHLTMLKNMLEYYTVAEKRETISDMIEQRLAGACNMQYLFFFALRRTSQHRRELIEFDNFLKSKYPSFYKKLDGRQITFLRKTHFIGYRVVALQKMWKDRSLKQNLFAEG